MLALVKESELRWNRRGGTPLPEQRRQHGPLPATLLTSSEAGPPSSRDSASPAKTRLFPPPSKRGDLRSIVALPAARSCKHRANRHPWPSPGAPDSADSKRSIPLHCKAISEHLRRLAFPLHAIPRPESPETGENPGSVRAGFSLRLRCSYLRVCASAKLPPSRRPRSQSDIC